VAGGWRRPHNEFHSLYASQNIIMANKSRRIRWVGPVARVGTMRNALMRAHNHGAQLSLIFLF
jgi:hypothetical protein